MERWALQDEALAGPLAPLLHPRLVAALSQGDVATLLEPVGPGLLTLPVLSDSGRRRLLAEIDAIEAATQAGQLALDAPNSMHVYGVQLAQVGLDRLAQALCREVAQPVAAVGFPELGPLVLDDAHGFTVSYAHHRDRDLAFHVDDATVTLNLCLAHEGDGAEVVFEGVRCPDHRQDATRDAERVAWLPQTGVALVHLGAHRHSTRPIQSGRRTNLIVWCRDPARPTLGACGPWCGAHDAAAT